MLSSIDEKHAPLAAIFGIEGEILTADEVAFFETVRPFGFILFARNCREPGQVKTLVESLHRVAGREVPVLIDQEGGRVQRLKPPHWTQYPAMATFGDSCDWEALSGTIADLSDELAEYGFNVDCAPVLDVRYPDTHDALGNRIFAADPALVAALGAVACEAFLAGGILPVVKHLPGLGRADLDTHHELPVVDADLATLEKTDFVPFRDIAQREFAGAVWGMVSHAIYAALDKVNPASCSKAVIAAIRGTMGFDGLLLSDDLSMGALGQVGDDAKRAVRVLEAGCDIALHCNGKLADMRRIAESVPGMTKAAVLRYNRSISTMDAFLRETV